MWNIHNNGRPFRYKTQQIAPAIPTTTTMIGRKMCAVCIYKHVRTQLNLRSNILLCDLRSFYSILFFCMKTKCGRYMRFVIYYIVYSHSHAHTTQPLQPSTKHIAYIFVYCADIQFLYETTAHIWCIFNSVSYFFR